MVGFNATTKKFIRAGSHTWHDDESVTLTVPDDGVSLVGLYDESCGSGERCFWPAALHTVAQVATARRICAKFGLDFCGSGDTSPEVAAFLEAERAEAEALSARVAKWNADRAEARKVAREAARRHTSATWANPMRAAWARLA